MNLLPLSNQTVHDINYKMDKQLARMLVVMMNFCAYDTSNEVTMCGADHHFEGMVIYGTSCKLILSVLS